MYNIKQLQTLFDGNKVDGRGEFCPRKGVYKLIEISSGMCYGKNALMAKTLWKPSIADEYQIHFVVDLQLESFKDGEPDKRELWVDREIVVSKAKYNLTNKIFDLEWYMIRLAKISIDRLNNLLITGDQNVSDCLFNSPYDVTLDDDIGDDVIY